MIDATLLSALPTLFRQIVIVSRHNCPQTTLILAMVATITLPGLTPSLVVVISGTSTPYTSLLPHLSHIAMAGGAVLQLFQVLKVWTEIYIILKRIF